jgi:formylglycine-generating enzyme required for sulfatase activity/nitrous oxidase accessory protein NosD
MHRAEHSLVVRRHGHCLTCIVLLTAALVLAAASGGCSVPQARGLIHVSPTGSPDGDGSDQQPVATIQRGIDLAQPGDVVKVAPGQYAGNIRLRSHVSVIGAGVDHTTVSAEQGDVVTANVANALFEGFTVDGMNMAKNGLTCDWEYVASTPNNLPLIVRKNVFKNMTGHGVYSQYARIVLESNRIAHTGGSGVHLFRADSTIVSNDISYVDIGVYLQDRRAELRHNRIDHTYRTGIQVHNMDHCILYRNDLSDMAGDGITCESNSAPSIVQNSIERSGRHGVYSTSRSAPVLRGNRITGHAECGVQVDGGKEAGPPVDLGRADDLGRNSIWNNGGHEVRNTSPTHVYAVGNWWGSTDREPRIQGQVDFADALLHQPTFREFDPADTSHTESGQAGAAEPDRHRPGKRRIVRLPDGKTTMDFVWIPSGMLRVGDGLVVDSARVVPVRGFWMGVHEVTREQFRAFVRQNPQKAIIGDLPQQYVNDNRVAAYPRHAVRWVDWRSARKFCEWSGTTLPTQIQWEYAAKGGKNLDYATSDGTVSVQHASYRDTARQTLQVRAFLPNPFGLFDMSGNVWEWCQDELPGGGRPIRGGAYNSPAYELRTSYQVVRPPGEPTDATGFRCVLTDVH